MQEVIEMSGAIMKEAHTGMWGELSMQRVESFVKTSKNKQHQDFAIWLLSKGRTSSSAFKRHDINRGGALDMKELERAVHDYLLITKRRSTPPIEGSPASEELSPQDQINNVLLGIASEPLSDKESRSTTRAGSRPQSRPQSARVRVRVV